MYATKDEMKDLDRLKKRSDFLAVSASGAKWVSKSMIVLAVRHDGPVRYGITVTKKLDKRATVRNRMKRRLRAVCAEILPAVAANGDYVLIARPETASRPFDELRRDLRWCLGKLGHARP